jgi:glycosyltransferase involved in cell wall biosynthesis
MVQKILYFVSEDWYFCSHRLPLALAAMREGYSASLVTRVNTGEATLRSHGLNLLPIDFSRRGRGIIHELKIFVALFGILRREKPTILHNVAMKPVLLGTLAARLAGVPKIVNALGGLGFLFIANDCRTRLYRRIVHFLCRLLLNGRNIRLILQNKDDLHLLVQAGVDPAKIVLIRGSGVDLKQFYPRPEPEGDPVVVLASRMLWDKGVGEFVQAASLLASRGVRARFLLVGDPDPENPASITLEQLRLWDASGVVHWIGKHDDMPSIFAASHIVVLPSYREGLPKVLLEAAACGRPIVTTDSPGCRDVVRNGMNGFLVPVRDHVALADAIQTLISMTRNSVAVWASGAERWSRQEFSLDKIIAETLAVYEELLAMK